MIEIFNQNLINYHNPTYGMDCPKLCVYGRDWWHLYPVQDFDYKFNSWGFREQELSTLKNQPVILCVGDSMLVNLGGPIHYSWPSLLQNKFDIPVINLGTPAVGNDGIRNIYEQAIDYFDVRATFVMYSHFHRRIGKNMNLTSNYYSDEENLHHFDCNRLSDAIECAIPYWCFSPSERAYLDELDIFYIKESDFNYDEFKKIPRKFSIFKDAYKKCINKGWPSYKQYIYSDLDYDHIMDNYIHLFIDKRAGFVNRDGWHCNFRTNQLIAERLYRQYKENHHES